MLKVTCKSHDYKSLIYSRYALGHWACGMSFKKKKKIEVRPKGFSLESFPMLNI